MGDSRFHGRNVLVTGAGSGIGRATALRFLSEGAEHVLLMDRDPARLDAVAQEARDLRGHATPVVGDVGVASDCVRAVETAVAGDGRLDVLVSNAAAWVKKPFLELDKESWDRVLAVNLTASLLLGQLAARVMKESGGGVILYTASIAAFGASRLHTPYCVSKAGIVNLVRCMAFELGQYNIRVNSISPGPSDTQQSVDTVGEERMREFRHRFPVVPLGERLGRPEEMAAVLAFLASDDASYITGENVVVDGGLMTHAYSSSSVVVSPGLSESQPMPNA